MGSIVKINRMFQLFRYFASLILVEIFIQNMYIYMICKIKGMDSGQLIPLNSPCGGRRRYLWQRGGFRFVWHVVPH